MDILFRITAVCVFGAALHAKDIEFKAGVTELDRPLVLEADEAGVHLRGAPSGSTLKASAKFTGAALIIARGIRHLSIERLKIDGNRGVLEKPFPIAPYDQAFADFYPLNGILADRCEGVILRDLDIRNVVNFPILVSRSQQVRIQQSRIDASGSRDEKGRNNTTGGILLEEGVGNFEVRYVKFRNIRGNGLWTHSRYESPRNRDGLIQENDFNAIGRDAIQVGHASSVRVILNTMANIGFPVELVDVEHGGIPVGIDTAGNVDKSLYAENLILEVNGKCIDLDGFHHGEVRQNRCVNVRAAKDYPQGHYGIVMNNTNPDMRSEAILIEDNEIEGMKYGGVFLIGRNHIVRKNRLRWLNTGGCTESHSSAAGCYVSVDEPGMLRSGIYFGAGAERLDPARANIVEDNLITGYRMGERCLEYSPRVDAQAQTIARNVCLDADPSIRGKKK